MIWNHNEINTTDYNIIIKNNYYSLDGGSVSKHAPEGWQATKTKILI